MPYSNISELPDHVKKHDEKKQRQWLHVWESVFSKTKSEERAFKAANAILTEEREDLDKYIEECLKTQEGDTVTEEFKLKAKDIKSVETVPTEDGILLKSVPVFKAGKYGEKEYDNKYIDEKIIGQFDAEEDTPFQSDHSDSNRDTLGYVRGLKRDGEFVHADIELIDDNAIARWKKGLLKKFSVGMYTATGKLREISAVAFPRVKEAVVHSEEVTVTEKKKDEEAGEKKMADEKKVEELLKEAAETQTKLETERDTLKTQLSEKDKEIATLKDTIKKTKVSEMVTSLKAEGKILPAVEEKTKAFMMTLEDAGLDSFVAVLKDNKNAVEMGEHGQQKSEKTDVKKAWADDHSAEECIGEAKKRSELNKTSYKEEYDKLFEIV